MIAIIDYKAGNTQSVSNAIERLGYKTIITHDLNLLRNADKVIFPGVGQAKSALNSLKEYGLDEFIPTLNQPVLGICLGMQLLCDYSEEGDTKGLGIFKTIVRQFPSNEIVPHIGWNNHTSIGGKLMDGIYSSDDFYFVHSYYAEVCEQTKAELDYILPFTSVLENNNFYGTQFHPEKSGENGHLLLQNFLKL